MSPVSYDPKAVVGGPAATLTVAGLAVGLLSGFVQPLYAWIAGGVGVVLAIVFWMLRARPALRAIAHLGVGLVVGAGLYYVLTAAGIMPSTLSGRS